MSAVSVAVGLNRTLEFIGLRDDSFIETPYDPIVNVMVLSALVLHFLFCGSALTISAVGPPFPRRHWLVSEAHYPYNMWILMGAVALSLDYVGALMYTFPRTPLVGAVYVFLLPIMLYRGYRSVRR